MELSELLSRSGIAHTIGAGWEIEDIVYDSRKSVPDTLFVALRGFKSDGHDYMQAAYRGGCRVFVCEEERELPSDAFQIVVPDSAVALAELSACFFGYPAKKLKLIGVTGTKGKTTVTTLIRGVLSACGKKTGLIGTTGVYIGDTYHHTVNTTPESYRLQKYFAEMVEAGVEYAVMEVSSQAYLCHRVYGLDFDIGVFTNLSPDHIGPGECRDYGHYRECKGHLFENSRVSVINADDPECGYYSALAKDVVTYSLEKEADYKAGRIDIWKDPSAFGICFEAGAKGEKVFVKSRIPGRYSAYNLLAVLAVCEACGVRAEKTCEVLPSLSVRGRFEIVDALDDATVVIDFAHNELSLESVLATIREYEPGRVVALFGSVGGRSQVRRAGMGRVASELADHVILTSDDPDREDVRAICDDIIAGMTGSATYEVIPDRVEAVGHALESARAGDVILLAGKGHQDYELINGVKEPYDERAAVMRFVKIAK